MGQPGVRDYRSVAKFVFLFLCCSIVNGLFIGLFLLGLLVVYFLPRVIPFKCWMSGNLETSLIGTISDKMAARMGTDTREQIFLPSDHQRKMYWRDAANFLTENRQIIQLSETSVVVASIRPQHGTAFRH